MKKLKCAESCALSKNKECTCACGGVNHGVIVMTAPQLKLWLTGKG